ncbi:MAG: ribonuclease Z [Deltaproteobacteria bacterium]|nr:ribonuclease Z [Deltaproteobacteria bacterium]
MTGLSVVALGVGDAFTARHYSSSLLVECGGARLLVDCPHPIRRMMRDAGLRLGEPVDVDGVDAVVITHVHADHVSGLEGFAYYSHFMLHRRVTLLAHPVVATRLWDGHLAAGMDRLLRASGAPPWPTEEKHFTDYFVHVPLEVTAPVVHGPFTIECRFTVHHVPTTALRIRAGGACLGYSADTAFDPGLLDWLTEADLVIHETNHGVHTPYERLAALPEALRARLRLIHYPDDFDDAASVIRVLREGERVAVGPVISARSP